MFLLRWTLLYPLSSACQHNDSMHHQTLVARWRGRAQRLHQWGALEAAGIWKIAAEELEQWDEKHANEALTLKQAEAESGFTAGHMGRLLSEGALENIGEPGAPRVRRSDLPRKPRRRQAAPVHGPDLAAEVLKAKGIVLDP